MITERNNLTRVVKESFFIEQYQKCFSRPFLVFEETEKPHYLVKFALYSTFVLVLW